MRCESNDVDILWNYQIAAWLENEKRLGSCKQGGVSCLLMGARGKSLAVMDASEARLPYRMISLVNRVQLEPPSSQRR